MANTSFYVHLKVDNLDNQQANPAGILSGAGEPLVPRDDPSGSTPKVPLGAGSIFGECFSIFFRNFPAIYLLGIPPLVLGLLLPALLLGFGIGLSDLESREIGVGLIIPGVLMAFLVFASYAVMTTLPVQLAYDAKLGQKMRVGRYYRTALVTVTPVLILSLGVFLVLAAATFLLGFVTMALPFFNLLIIPVQIFLVLWILAMFSLMAPAVVIERVGLRGLARSAELTRGYRWAVLGTLVLTGICSVIVNGVIGFLAGFVGGLISDLVANILIATIYPASLATFGIVVALIYARLREIKEGVSVDQIAAVFE